MKVIQIWLGHACGFHCLMGFLKAESVENIFMSLDVVSQIFGPKWGSTSES